MDLKKLAEKTTPLTIPVDDDELNIRYRPHAILVGDTLAESTSPAEMIDQICRAVASWDLTDGGVPVPISPEGIRGVPMDVLGAVMQRIVEDQNPGMNGSRSSAT